MKKILCFGDSNTFGYNPKNGLRYSVDIRWTGILQKECSDSYTVIEAGCNNRTCFRYNPQGEFYTGNMILPKYLEDKPDVVVLALGSNDLQRQYRTSLLELEYGIETLVKITQKYSPEAKIVILAPSPIGDEVLVAKIFAFLFDEVSIQKSKELPLIYQRVAKKLNCYFVDLSLFAKVSQIDGLHYEEDAHILIAKNLYSLINSF